MCRMSGHNVLQMLQIVRTTALRRYDLGTVYHCMAIAPKRVQPNIPAAMIGPLGA